MNRHTLGTHAVIAAVFFAVSFGLGGVCAAGQLTYPALGNIDFEQGTIEMWLVPQFDTTERIDGAYWGRRFFQVSQDEDNRLALMWRITANDDSQNGGPYVTGRSEGDRFAAFTRVWHRVGVDDDGWAQGEAK
ncbi:MAG: hypothetical protein ACODAQ_12770, partial [Phycisphaeraceae bacterium]